MSVWCTVAFCYVFVCILLILTEEFSKIYLLIKYYFVARKISLLKCMQGSAQKYWLLSPSNNFTSAINRRLRLRFNMLPKIFWLKYLLDNHAPHKLNGSSSFLYLFSFYCVFQRICVCMCITRSVIVTGTL